MIHKIIAFLLFLSTLFIGVGLTPQIVSAQVDSKHQVNSKSKKDKKRKSKSKNKPLKKKENPVYIGKRNINGGFDRFSGWLGGSRKKELIIGRQLSAQIEQQFKIIDDPKVAEYINRVGQNIVLHSDAKVSFTIKVIDSEEVNAFALPGGFFFVNKGLIIAADNEAELAGVMAHEIAHVTARHAMENAGKGRLLNLGILAGIIFTGGVTGAILKNTAGLSQMLAFFKFSRKAEEEADMLGVQYLYASGYDPRGMATMFEKLVSKNKKKPGAFSKLFSSHPQSIDRQNKSLALIARFPEKQEYIISTSEFQKVKEYLLRTSNVGIAPPDLNNNTEQGRPTLKRRQPAQVSSSPGTGKSTKTDNDPGPPKLKRRDAPKTKKDKENKDK